MHEEYKIKFNEYLPNLSNASMFFKDFHDVIVRVVKAALVEDILENYS